MTITEVHFLKLVHYLNLVRRILTLEEYAILITIYCCRNVMNAIIITGTGNFLLQSRLLSLIS